MKVTVISNIPGKLEVSGQYTLKKGTTIAEFTRTLGLVWNLDALVVVNEKIVSQEYRLEDQDEVHLLIPILGG